MNIPLIVPIDNRIDLLPYHAAYYSRLGFRLFVVALWNGDSNPVREKLYESWASGLDKALAKDCEFWVRPSLFCDYDHYNGPAETPGLNTIRMEFVKHDEWYCVADLDEFYWWGGLTLLEMVEVLDRGGYLALHGTFYDRVSRDGSFPAIPPFEKGKTQLDDLFPCVADLARVTNCGTNKISLARLTGIRSGHHFATLPADKVLNNGMQAHHFKWHGGVLDLLEKRHKAYGSQGLAHAHESKEFHDFFQQPDWIKSPLLNTREAMRIGI